MSNELVILILCILVVVLSLLNIAKLVIIQQMKDVMQEVYDNMLNLSKELYKAGLMSEEIFEDEIKALVENQKGRR